MALTIGSRLLQRAVLTGVASLMMLAGFVGAPMVSAHAREESRLPKIAVAVSGSAPEMPSALHAGWTDFTFVNTSSAPAEVQFVRLHEGRTPADALAAFQAQNPDAAVQEIGSFQGGANTLNPGASQEVYLKLTRGSYVAVSFSFISPLPLITPFRVYGSGDGGPKPGEADGTITLYNNDTVFKIQVSPGAQRDGTVVATVSDIGTQPHEYALHRLLPGVTQAQAKQCLFDPTCDPFNFVALDGGLATIEPGTTAYLVLRNTPGTYFAACFVIDSRTGDPHFLLGMYTFYTVQSSGEGGKR